MSRYYRSTIGVAQGCAMLLTVFLILGTLVAAMCVDLNGAKANNHRGPIPQGIHKLDAGRYVAPLTFNPDLLCGARGDANDSHGGGDTTALGHGLNLVTCNRDQTWNDHRAGSPDYAHALGIVLSSRYFFMVLGGLLLAVAVILGLSFAEEHSVRRSSEAKEANETKMSEYMSADLNAARRELIRAWAKEGLPLHVVQARLTELYARGVKPAEATYDESVSTCGECGEQFPGDDYLCSKCRDI